MMRFVGAAIGTAGVAAAWPDLLPWLFAACATVAAGGLILSFSGREMPDDGTPVPGPVTTVRAD
jgi:hypothetical protein